MSATREQFLILFREFWNIATAPVFEEVSEFDNDMSGSQYFCKEEKQSPESLFGEILDFPLWSVSLTDLM